MATRKKRGGSSTRRTSEGIGFVRFPILWIWQIYDEYVANDGPTKRDLKHLGRR
jgi:hypothetical protein